MKTISWSRIGAVGAACLVAAGTLVAAGPGSETVTVGWFLHQVAVARQIPSSSEHDAWAALRGAGIELPRMDAAKVLTEGDVVEIGRSLGLNVDSSTPSAPFDRIRAQAFAETVVPGTGVDAPSTRDSGGTPNDASNNGKGKKKGHNKSSSEPL